MVVIQTLPSMASLEELIQLSSSFTRMMVIVNGKSSEPYEINADIPQGSLRSSNFFLYFINNLPMNFLGSLIDIYAA